MSIVTHRVASDVASNSGDVQAEVEDNSSRMEWKEDWTGQSQGPFQLRDYVVCERVSLCTVDITFNTSPHPTDHPAQACLGNGEKMFAGAWLPQRCTRLPLQGPLNEPSRSSSLFATLVGLNCSKW